MSEQKPKYSTTEPDISKTKPSSGIQKSDHYGSMPDMSASGGLKPPELTRRESTVDPVDVSSDFSFIGTDPLFSSSPIPQDKKVFNFDLADNSQDQNNEKNMGETHQSDDKTMYHTATSQVSEASVGSDNTSTESIPGRDRRSISEHTKSKSSNLDQHLLRRASSGKLKETELNPLKTVDSVRQYFTKPSELLKRKLKHTSQENEQDLSNKKETDDFVKGKEHKSGPHQEPVPSQIKVVQYQEKEVKETVESKHKEHDTFEQEVALKEDKVPEEFQKGAVDKLSIHKNSSDQLRIKPSHYTDKVQKQRGGNEKNDILTRSYSEPKTGQAIRNREDRKYRSHDSHVGYDPHHDFTSVVDFLEVLKVQEEESRMTGSHVTNQREADEEENEDSEHKTVEESMDDDQESVRTIDTGSVKSIVDFIESRKQKYTPVVPSPLTYIPSSNQLENREESGEVRQIVHHNGEKDSRTGEVDGDVTGHGTNISGSTLSYTTPSKLLKKVEISKEKSPGYGEIEYTTPSKLGMEKQESSLSNSTPSELEVEKYESAMSYTTPSEQEIEKYESTLSYATPSMVGMERQDSIFSYTTPSKLLEKVEIREGRRSKDKFSGYGEIEYTTPSKLGMENQDSTLSKPQTSKLVMEKQDSTLSYTTPSKLLEKVEIREGRARSSNEEFPGYGEIEYTTPSKLEMEKRDSNFSYITPSELLEKVEIRESRSSKEKSPGYGEIEYTIPSKLGMEKQDSTLSYTTPSKLLEKVEIREGRRSKDKSPGYGEIEYTTPSKLGMEKQESTLSNTQAYKLGIGKQASALSYTTPSKLLEKVEIREGRRNKDEFPGYGEIEYTTPSNLGMEKQESSLSNTTPSMLRMERQAAAAASNLSYTTPSKLLEKVEIRERREKKGKFPGYGEMEYTAASQLGMIERKDQSVTEHNGHPTSTELLNQVETREVRRHSSPETLDNITPSELLEFNVQQEQERTSSSEGSASDTLSSEMYINMEENSGYGDSSISIQLELADLTPKPSNKRLAERPKKPEQMSSPNITTVTGAPSDESYKGSLHRVLSAPDGKLRYSLDTTEPSGKQEPSNVNRNISTTPSKLLEKVETRERREKKDKFPGYGVLDYTTPSKLGIKQRERVDSDLYPTSSKLLEKVETREKRANREMFPGYGVLEYRTPSKLVTEPYEEKKAEEQPLLYTTPSELLENIRKRERREMSSGHSLLEYETQAKIAAEQNKTRGHKDLLEMHTTPSKLLEKVELREKRRKKEEFPGYGVLDYRTPSNMNAEHAEDNNKPLIDQTPSTVLDEGQVKEKRQNLANNKAPSKLNTKNIKEKIDDKGQILYTTPSKLLEKVEKREDRERRKEREFRYHDGRKSLHSDLSYTTPSKLLEKVEKREDRACRKDQPGYGTLEYTTPSKLIGLSQNQQEDERMPSGTEVNRNGKRSLEQTECRSPTISELFEGVRQGNHGNRAPERTHYGSPTISEVFEMVRQGNYGNRAPEITRYGSFSSTTPSIIAKKLGYGDSKTSFQQEEPSETANQSNRRLVDRPRNSGQTLNREQMVQSDTMMSAPTEDDSERLLHFHRITSAPNRLSNSQNDANKSLNDSGLDTETSSITENDKSKEEKRSQWEREAILSHIHSDITAYFSKQPSEEGYPNKRHRSEPEFFGSFCDFSSHPSLIDQDTDDAYNIKGTEPLLSSSSSSGGARVPVDTSSSETTDAIVMDDIQYDEVQKYNGKVQNKHLFPKESEISSSYPLSLDSLRNRESLSTFNPSFLTFGSNSFTEESTSSGKSSEESVLPMYKPVDDTASINQLFWSMYSSYPDLMQRFLNSDTGTPSQSALSSLSDLYSNALHSFTSDDHPNQEVHYSTGTQKKRALPQSPTSSAPDSRSFFMEKELMESQNRKLQLEISTLTTENKLFKDKYNRAAAKISDLEEELNETKSEYESLQQSVNEEVSEVQRKSKSQIAQDTDHLQSKVTSLVHENEQLKSEVMYLETQLQTANGVVEMARHNNDKNKTLEAYKMEVTSLKDEVIKVKSLLEQSERHLHEEETRSRETSQQVIKLTEMKNLLQHQVDMSGGGNTVVDKQIKSLEKRLRVTEERLHQERSDRANNLSAVEDKLLTENARLQATEKELSRQLQREKDKNCNLEQKTKDVKNENEKLRLQVPFDETSLTSHKYDIPYSTHSSQRHESAKNHDFKHIASQLEQQAGVKSEIDMICHLWITREQAYNQLRHLELMLQDLNLRDNDVTEGLKNLRDLKHQYEVKLKQAEEKSEDCKSEKLTFEATYKEQLTSLVKERHEAFAKLKTAEDLLEATRSENEILRKNLPALSAGSMQSLHGTNSEKQSQLVQIQELEGKVQSLTRSNQMSEGEITTLKVQMEAREKTLRDVESELELANSKMDLDNGEERKQQKIDKLTAQVNSKQAELGLMNDKYNRLLAENRSLEMELDITKLDLTSVKTKQREITGIADTKMSFSVKEELEDKSRQIEKMAEEIEKLDSALQQTRQDLYQEQLQCNNFEGQVEGMQQEFEERGRIIDAISETEMEQLSQYKVLKNTLDSVNADLKKKEGKIKIQEVELSQQTDKINQLERKLSLHNETTGGVMVPEVTELERDKIKSELLEAYSKLKTTEEEMREMASELQQIQEELTNQKAELLQLSSEKGELEQHLEEIAEEHDALIQEKAQSEEDIVKLENKLQELVETLEIEARKQHGNFGNEYENIPAEFSQMAEELGTLRSLLESKDKELEMFQTKASRQQMDLEFLQRRIELLHSDNQSNREDIARMTNQLILKIKEGVESRQLNEYLSGERVKQQNELSQLEQNLERTAQLQVVKQTEIEKSEFSKKDATISVLEKSSEQVRKALQDNEYENVQLRYRIETLTNDQRKLSTINSSLETKLEMEKKMYDESHQEVTSLNHKLDLHQREHDHVLNNLNTEKQLKEKLNNDCQIYSSENKNLRQELRDIQSELDSCQKQLTSSQESLKDAKQDKGVMYHEYENMIKRMSEKDQKIIELQTKLDITVADMEKELHLQKHTHELEKTSTERELDITKEQVTTLSSEMKNKDSELSTFGRSLQELEEATRKKKELESEHERSQMAVHDMKILLDSHKKEIQQLQESLSRHQENVSRTQLEKAGVEDKLYRLEESSTVQIQELKKTIADMKSSNEGEKFYLKDNLSQTQSQIQSLQSSLSSAVTSRDKLQIECRLLQRTVEETREQLHDTSTSRKVAEQRADTLEGQLHDSRKDRFLTEEKLNQSLSTVSRLEREQKLDKEKLKAAIEASQEYEATAYGQESNARAKQEKVDVLQNEVGKLKQILETQKVQMNSKLKKSAKDLSQQMELIESDRNKVSQQNTQLFTDLEKSRETVQTKNKENLKLREDMLQLQEQVKELSFKLKHSDEAKKAEEELQSKLQKKLDDQEDELKRVRNFLTKKTEESGEAEKSAWHDMNKMIHEMSQQMSMHLESQKTSDNKDQDAKVAQRYKKHIHDLNTELQTERALHKITASSLQSLEEDCVRLRQQCQAMRKRNNSASDKRYKSRMEAINEIIARSQTQAQAMLASGNYLDESLKSLASPRVTFETSPDNSVCSDMSFNSTIAINSESSPLNPTMKSTPRKT
ncbi:uncharacterized protein LOC134716406 [Mytilus trossulus]|uniref:uncharacterized protein LOC134716406 n=1 Tax=Mytilus trossulus TaxID=6551 RepID=UPI00300639FD